MADFANILHASAPTEPGKPVIMPGEIELGKMRRQREAGVVLDATTLGLLHKYAGLAAG